MWAKDAQTDGDQIPAEFTFVLKAGTTIGGIVQDEEGQPIAGAKVNVLNIVSSYYTVVLATPRKPPNRPVPVHELAEVTTDADGRWQATNIPPDADLAVPADANEHIFRNPLQFNPPLRLEVSHPDFETFGETKRATSDWGANTSSEQTLIQAQVNPTLKELRSGEAVVVLRGKQRKDTSRVEPANDHAPSTPTLPEPEPYPTPGEHPFVVLGRVTDKFGNPLNLVEVRVNTGIGTLTGGSVTLTSEDGHYSLILQQGMFLEVTKSQPLGVSVQAAQFSLKSKEDNQLSINDAEAAYLMTDYTPELIKSTLRRASDDHIIYAHKPKEINFVMRKIQSPAPTEPVQTP